MDAMVKGSDTFISVMAMGLPLTDLKMPASVSMSLWTLFLKGILSSMTFSLELTPAIWWTCPCSLMFMAVMFVLAFFPNSPNM